MNENENNKLATVGKLGPAKVGLAAKLEIAKQAGKLNADNLANFGSYNHRIILIVDDSGSMGSWMDKLETKNRITACREACEAFLQVCSPADTVVGMYTISTDKQTSLNWDYKNLLLQVKELAPYGGTPTFKVLDAAKQKENMTRSVLISDGASNEHFSLRDTEDHNATYFGSNSRTILDKYKEAKISVDTVFIGPESDETGMQEMKDIATYTGGLFIHFKDASSFASKFKYLAPAFYGLLKSGEITI